LASEITVLIKSLSSELGLSSVAIKEVLEELASQPWAEQHDDDTILRSKIGVTTGMITGSWSCFRSIITPANEEG